MYQQRRPLYLYCETPLHAGSGSDLGIVDLPIQRERATGFPKIEASSLKGAVREHFTRLSTDDGKLVSRVFGPAPDSDNANTFAGSVTFTDARLLAMPVRSAAGVFAWITCPAVLGRWATDCQLNMTIPRVGKGHGAVLSSTEVIPHETSKIVLEEFTFEKQELSEPLSGTVELARLLFADSPSLQDKFVNDLVILHDEDFAYFVQNATEVITRIRVSQQSGTVEQGALWTEEYLPTESVLYSVVLTSDEFLAKDDQREGAKRTAGQNLDYLTGQLNDHPRFQLGGNATLGKGHLYTQFANENTVA